MRVRVLLAFGLALCAGAAFGRSVGRIDTLQEWALYAALLVVVVPVGLVVRFARRAAS